MRTLIRELPNEPIALFADTGSFDSGAAVRRTSAQDDNMV
jgi:hypothetical protein